MDLSRIYLAVFRCGSIGALFTFPGLRMARMQWDVLSYTDNKFVTVILNTGHSLSDQYVLSPINPKYDN